MGQSLCIEAWEAMAGSSQNDGVESIDFDSPKEQKKALSVKASEDGTENDGNSSENSPTKAEEMAEETTKPEEPEQAKQDKSQRSEPFPPRSKNGNAENADASKSAYANDATPETDETVESSTAAIETRATAETAATPATSAETTESDTKPIDPVVYDEEKDPVRDTPSTIGEEDLPPPIPKQEPLVPVVEEDTVASAGDTASTSSPTNSNGRPSPSSLRREQSVASETPSTEKHHRPRENSITLQYATRDSEGVGHNRSRSEGILTFEDATRLQASWSNADPEEFSPFSHAKFGHHSSTFLDEPSRTSISMIRVSAVEDPSMPESNVSSVIHDAARITNWGTVKSLCETDPEAASFVGRDRWTALHHACNRRCPYADVVEALITAYPDALLQEEDKGWLPLHYACRFKAPKEVVRLLIHQFPEKGRMAVKCLERQGRTPLYYAVRYDAPPGVVGLLLEVDASAVLEEDQNADSPLALVWDAWAEKMDGKRTLQRIYIPESEAETMALEDQAAQVEKRLKSQKKLYGRWNKVNIFLKAAFGFSVEDDDEAGASNIDGDSKIKAGGKKDANNGRKWRILHATAAIKCHPSLFMLARSLHPEQCFEIDDKDLKGPVHISGDETAAHGLTALHLAASSHANGESSRLVITELLRMNPAAAEEVDSSNSLPFHRVVENKYKPHWSEDGAKDIYLANTAAISATDRDGKLPLHRAASAITYSESSSTATKARSAICNLLELRPEAAEHSDSFGCLPLHLVAQSGSQWDYQVQSLYDANPAAAQVRSGVKMLNRLPLHMAASNPSSEFSMIDTLVQMNPRGATQADRKGNYPLHLACAAGLSWESINSIHKAYPEAIQEAEGNDRGWTALQIAASNSQINVDVISNLSEIYPLGAGVADNDGRYAFHLSCFAGRKWEEGLSALFQAYPDALGTPDRKGLLPFHIVSFRYSASPEEAIPEVQDPSQNERGFSKSASIGLDAEQYAMKELEDAKRIENLFHLLKADPTVLSTQ
ncbi:unnamed protein product [Cylindrotheca closterium]|uniref:Uncharacterized protein n=1 Tax=Cylindrotheca closterium TaxID=2856 RepID=A0AAD2CAE7_9STRA|nr:unnamed protein product [Cylindrotheca closterium]